MEWVPSEGAAFQCIEDFATQLDIYMLAKGLRYHKFFDMDSDGAVYVYCPTCKQGEKGKLSLHFKRCQQQPSYCLRITHVRECTCRAHSPWPWMDRLKEKGPSVLENRIVGTEDDWRWVAKACFPNMFVNRYKSRRKWSVVCITKGCPGRIIMAVTGKRNAAGKRPLNIESVVECCQDCKDKVCDLWVEVVTEDAQQRGLASCPLCCDDNLTDWVELPCGKEICTGCLKKLINFGCPEVIQEIEGVAIFEPESNSKHFYTCPFCKSPYYPTTELQRHIWDGKDHKDGHASTINFLLPVQSMVETPYAYQSFDITAGRKASVTREEYPTVMEQYVVYRQRDEEEKEEVYERVRGA